MPATLNGVGTHYYGKSNKSSRTGVCQACGATCQLDSYDTRLWFVVLFIPVIPLGRKRITDQCSRCQRHFVAGKRAYETAMRDNITAAMETYEKHQTPENALEFHGSLLAFNQYDKAKDFRELAMKRHRADDVLFQGLTAQMEHIGRATESGPFYESAYALRPDLPEICAGVADARIADGNLDEARRLLKPLETPGAAEQYSLERLETLARAYQRAGQHDETLAICKHLLAELPHLGEMRPFRRLVSVSEKAQNRPESILPKQGFSIRGLFGGMFDGQAGWRRKLAVGIFIVALIAIALVGSNEYIRRHRNVYLVNDGGRPVKVAIDGQAAVDVGSMERIQLAEGRHRVKISGPVNDEFDIDLHTEYYSRWFNNPVWVVGVDGGSALLLNTMHYAVNPGPTETKLVLVDRMFHLPDVDYPFTTPPRTIDLDHGKSVKTKTHLERANVPAATVFQVALDNNDPAAWKYAEARLLANPRDTQLLHAYGIAGMKAQQNDRLLKFIKAGLDKRPFVVEWHRAYQNLAKNTDQAALIAEYDDYLKEAPDSAELLYLRGRIDDDHAKGHEYFQRACKADPKLPWPWMALAYDATSRGDWKLARELADKAFNLRLDDSTLHYIRFTSRMATGDWKALESECRQAFEAEKNLGQMLSLCEVLAAQKKDLDAQKVVSELDKSFPPSPKKGIFILNCFHCVWYMTDAPVIVDISKTPHSSVPSYFRLHTLLKMNYTKEAVKDPALRESLAEPWNALAVSVAYSLANNSTEADAWREKACVALDKGNADDKRAAALLRSEKPPTKQQLDDVVLYPGMKSLLAAALALRFPKLKAELIALARRLNVRRLPPYHLVRMVTEGKRIIQKPPPLPL